MADGDEWQQMDEYYWQGPAGWTICRVWVDGGWRHELWRPGADRPVGHRASLAGAVRLHGEQ